MRLTALASRYAAALFEAARDSDSVDKVESDLGLITYSLKTMPNLQHVLSHPLIPGDKKKEIAAEIFRGKVEGITLDFLGLLIDKRREDLMEVVEQEYVRFANDFRGVLPAMVTSAIPLTADEQRALSAKLEVFTGKKVELQLSEDASIIGGIVVKIGDTIIDGSVKGYLASLRDRLLGRE